MHRQEPLLKTIPDNQTTTTATVISLLRDPDGFDLVSNGSTPSIKRAKPPVDYVDDYVQIDVLPPQIPLGEELPAGYRAERNGRFYTENEYRKLIHEEIGAVYVAKIREKTYEIKLGCIDNESISYFTEGGCWMLMRALNDQYGWRMKAARRGDIFVHGFCILPSGDCIDITGIKTTDQALKSFNADSIEDCPLQYRIGQNIEFEVDSFMSTLRLASVFARTVYEKYLLVDDVIADQKVVRASM